MVKMNYTKNSSSLMESCNETPSLVSFTSNPKMSQSPDIIKDYVSLPLESDEPNHLKSFLLMDGNEKLNVQTQSDFNKQLDCNSETKVKVVSIFGNTGDGKSHTLNNTFFNGEEYFQTSAAQNSCTFGVWAAFQREMNLICLDTEGLLGTTDNENQRTRMLLKVLGISDIVIYRTRSARLHSDMYAFLGTASKAFTEHFSCALKGINQSQSTQALGPAIIIFHETRDTDVLDGTPEDHINDAINKMQMNLKAFSSVKYIGIKTTTPPTNYDQLKSAIVLLKKEKTRHSRKPEYVYKTLQALNLKFSGEMKNGPVNPFPEEYFTCCYHCESCAERCERSMGHTENHTNSKKCRYQHQYENKIYICKNCHLNGLATEVKITTTTSNDSWLGLAKYAWSGSVINCPNCGEIYRSRQYWYGNKTAEHSSVYPEIVHVWKGDRINMRGTVYSAQYVLDGFSYITDAVASVGAQPTKTLASWVTDKIAPTYWKQNSDIKVCHICKRNFELTGLSKHHCRNCGEGFCNTCSKTKMPVPNRGWFDPVRVCDDCKEELHKNSPEKPAQDMNDSNNSSQENAIDEANVTARKCGEVVFNTLSTMASVLEYPKDLIKHTARPAYWVPDAEALKCVLCDLVFGAVDEMNNSPNISPRPSSASSSPSSSAALANYRTRTDQKRHHCRKCGKGVCNACSLHRKPVPEHGWTSDVRICNSCIEIK